MSFYYRVLTYSLVLVLATAMGVPSLNIASTSPRDTGALTDCNDVVLDPNSTTLQRTSCFRAATPNANPPAKDPATAASGSASITFGSLALVGPSCEDDVITRTGPGLIDTTTLCELLPEDFVVPPAYSATSCACEVWSVGTAAFANCNCDTCVEADNTGDTLYAICANIYNVCITSGWERGYYTDPTPPVYWTLYATGGMIDDDVPLYSSC